MSKQTYECYVCKHNGFENVRVYLDGKDENNKTIYKNEDLSPHQHKQKQQEQEQRGGSTTILTQASRDDKILTLLNDINIKMNRVIKLLEGR